MKKSDAIDYAGSAVLLAEMLGISKSGVSQWGDIVPEKQALLLDKISNGVLVYDLATYQRDVDPEN